MAKQIRQQTAADVASTRNFSSLAAAQAAKPDNPNYVMETVVIKEDIIIPAGTIYTWAPGSFSPKWFVAQVLMNAAGDLAAVKDKASKEDELKAQLAAQAAELEALKAQLAAVKAA